MRTAIVIIACLVAMAYCAPSYGVDGSYGESEPRSYHGGPQGYGAPRPGYGAPRPSYGSPRPSYGGPSYGGPSYGGAPSGRYGAGPSHGGGYDNGRTYGRQMEYTVNGPHDRSKMKVTETHVQMDRRMSGQEAEQAMKQIMGSMQDSKGNFRDFVQEIGFGDFARY